MNMKLETSVTTLGMFENYMYVTADTSTKSLKINW